MALDTEQPAGDAVHPAQVDAALAAFVMLVGFLQRPADAEQLRQAIGKGSKPIDQGDLLRLAEALDLRAKRVAAPLKRLTRQPLPAIGWVGDGRYFPVLQANEDAVLVLRLGMPREISSRSSSVPPPQ